MPKSLLEMAASALQPEAPGEQSPAEPSVGEWVDEQQAQRRAQALFAPQPLSPALPRAGLLGHKTLFVTPDGREFETPDAARGHLLAGLIRDAYMASVKENEGIADPYLPLSWVAENYAAVKAALYKIEQET